MLDGRRIILVEDDDIMGGSLLQRLELEGAQVTWYKQVQRALGAIRTPQGAIDAVVCDIALHDGSGEDLFRRLCQTSTPPPFLFITGQGDIAQAVRLIKSGAADYITKPFDLGVFLERLSLLVSPSDAVDFPPVLGVSAAAHRVEELITRAATTGASVLLWGGPGLGKDLIARRIHDLSDRRAAPFVPVNVARESDPEAAIFGVGGAFDLVGDGTIFINAISRLPVDLQERLADELNEAASPKLIIACSQHLNTLIDAGQISAELYYRMAQMEIPVPPLGTRPEDAVWLIEQLFGKLAQSKAPAVKGISPLCIAAVRNHHWPGGGREVRARLLRGLSLTSGELLQPSDLFPERLAVLDEMMSLAEARATAEKSQIIAALDRTGGQIGETAKLLRIARTTLWEKMQKFGLSGS